MAAQQEHGAPQDVDALIQDLWGSVNRNVWHGMSCRCCGGGMFAIDSRMLEVDLLEYLADKYETEGVAQLKEAVELRARGSDSGLPAWLLGLSRNASIPAPLVQRLKQDVADVLQNMQDPQKF